jgi:DNA invertase Pin-like site-specific DNA recombinase
MELLERPREVETTHLMRKAVCYIRQSTPGQVRENQGSTAAQRDQLRHPRSWGWPEDRIELLDEDLGRSGTSSVNRPGYRRMVAELQAGQIGAIFLTDLSRAGRNSIELLLLLQDCQRQNTLLVFNGRVRDMSNNSEKFMYQMESTIMEFENARRRESLERGIIATVQRGRSVSNCPRGYVLGARKGFWEQDEDPAVRESVAAVFATYRQYRSLPRTASALISSGVQLPWRDHQGVLHWSTPTVQTICAMLRNPAYVGDYHFRRKRNDQSKGQMGNGRWRSRKASPEEVMIIANHHAPYVSHEEWNEVQHVLTVNAPSKRRRNLGPGRALLQGVIRCGIHDLSMAVRYGRPTQGGDITHRYQCDGEHSVGGRQCMLACGRALDRAVGHAIIARLASPSLTVVRDAWEQASAAEMSEERLQAAEIDRARRAVDQAKKRYLLVDPENRNVAEACEAMWEQEVRNLKRLEARDCTYDRSTRTAFTAEAWDELLSLCKNVSDIWNAPTTQMRDRKELARTLVDVVVVESQTPELIRARIVWTDGQPETLLEIRRSLYAHRLIVAWAADGIDVDEIVRRLNAEGLLTRQERSWSRTAVQGCIRTKAPKKTLSS